MALVSGCLLQLPIVYRVDADVAAPHLVIAGSGSNLAITRSLAEDFMRRQPDIRIEIPSSIGSKGGIRAVAEGNIDLGLTSRPLNVTEEKLGLSVQPYAHTAVILGVHPTVEENGLVPSDLVAILSGQRTRWRSQQEIVVFIREPGDSSIGVLEHGLAGFKAVFADAWKSRRWIALFTDQKMNLMLSKTPHAIGITDIGSITAGKWGVKALKVNGVYPSVDNIASRAYPLTKTLAFVFDPQALPQAAALFMDYATSADGSDVLRRNGYAPIH